MELSGTIVIRHRTIARNYALTKVQRPDIAACCQLESGSHTQELPLRTDSAVLEVRSADFRSPLAESIVLSFSCAAAAVVTAAAGLLRNSIKCACTS